MPKKEKAENRQFQDNWTEDYYFILNKGLPVCLLCNESVSVNKGQLEETLYFETCGSPNNRWETTKG
jgi:hypothetical protein